MFLKMILKMFLSILQFLMVCFCHHVKLADKNRKTREMSAVTK